MRTVDASYRGAFLAIIGLLCFIWWIGFVDVCNAFWRWLEHLS